MAIKNIITVGMQYGWLFPLRYIKHDKRGQQIWECVCLCGNRYSGMARSLASGNTRSCGCYNKLPRPHKRKSRAETAFKVCTQCGAKKPISEFTVRADSGLRRCDCKACVNSRTSEWVSKNRQRYENGKSAWYLSNREKILPKRREFWAENAERLNAAAASKKKEYRENNREACNARIRDWKKRNPGSIAFYGRTRQARLREAIPPWADLDKIEALYVESDRISRETGIRHHVDHIVPLIGRKNKVCGLHCEQNLRIITAEENLKKNGHHWPDMP